MQKEYEFYLPPLFDGIDEIEAKYEAHFKEVTNQSRETYTNLIKTQDAITAYEKASNSIYEDFINEYK